MPRKTAARIVAFAALAMLLGLGGWWALRAPDRITVASWGAEYGRAQDIAMFHPYTDESGVEVRVGLYGGGLTELTRQIESGKLEWDVVDFELPDAAEACRKGLLEMINPAKLPAGDNGTPASADFVPGALGPCWVGSVVYSQVIAFDPKRFPQAPPTRAADFFDLAAFPGGRGMKDSPKGNLELALIADGVPAKGVYEALSTPEGVARALAKLDTIRGAIQWWRTTDEAIAWLADGRAAMTTALNGRVLDAINKEHRSISVIWDGQRYELDVFGIPRGTPNKENALDFIRFATGTGPLARIGELLPYGPARRSSLRRAGLLPQRSASNKPENIVIAVDAEGNTYWNGVRVANNAEFLEQLRMISVTGSSSPTAHMDTAIYLDPDWWAVHGPVIEARWKEWRQR